MHRTSPTLDWENTVVLSVGEVLLGLVSPVFRGVAVDVQGHRVVIHVAVMHLDEEVEDDINDLVAETWGYLMPENASVTSEVFVGSARPGWAGRQHRLVFLAKDRGDDLEGARPAPTSR